MRQHNAKQNPLPSGMGSIKVRVIRKWSEPEIRRPKCPRFTPKKKDGYWDIMFLVLVMLCLTGVLGFIIGYLVYGA